MSADRGQTNTVVVTAICLLVAGVIAAFLIVRMQNRGPHEMEQAVMSEEPASSAAQKPLPRLLDLGAGKCVACKMMAPVLEDLKTAYQGRLRVDFIDVWENGGASKQYGVTVIPTQIFFDPSGKELFRHQGYISKEDILAKWKEFGYKLDG